MSILSITPELSAQSDASVVSGLPEKVATVQKGWFSSDSAGLGEMTDRILSCPSDAYEAIYWFVSDEMVEAVVHLDTVSCVTFRLELVSGLDWFSLDARIVAIQHQMDRSVAVCNARSDAPGMSDFI